MNNFEKIAMGFIVLAVIVALVAAQNTPKVATSIFGGASGLFGTILSPVGGKTQAYTQ